MRHGCLIHAVSLAVCVRSKREQRIPTHSKHTAAARPPRTQQHGDGDQTRDGLRRNKSHTVALQRCMRRGGLILTVDRVCPEYANERKRNPATLKTHSSKGHHHTTVRPPRGHLETACYETSPTIKLVRESSLASLDAELVETGGIQVSQPAIDVAADTQTKN